MDKNSLKQGYGAFLTKITFTDLNTLKKTAINKEGEARIKNEINFYRYCNKRLSNFNDYLPKINNITINSFEMEYFKQYQTLEKYLIKNPETINDILPKIFEILNSHLYIKKKNIEFNTFKQTVFNEILYKLLIRKEKIKHVLKKYAYIEKVNNIEILNFENIIYQIEKFLNDYLIDCDLLFYPIHGDLQLNNILIDDEQNIKFIDPKGCFGNSEIFGLREYDKAKIYFGLNGYSDFDLKEINNLDIQGNNININIKQRINIQDLPQIIQVLICTIWLGNAHCFINEEKKLIESYFYSLYISTIIFK